MDYAKTRAEIERRKAHLQERQERIPEEITKLNEEREQNKRELIGIEQVLDGLSFMDSDAVPSYETFGFTDGVRKILSETTVPLVPTQIRDALLQKGISGSSSKVLLINVHKVLERIDEELEKSTTPEGKTAYKRTALWTPGYLGYSGAYGQIARPFNLPDLGVVSPIGVPSASTKTARHAPALPIRRRRRRGIVYSPEEVAKLPNGDKQ